MSFIVGFELFFCEIFLYSDTMKYIWHLNFHSSLKESFKPSLSLPSQRRQVWYSSLRMSFHIGMAEDFNTVNLLSLSRWERESEFLHCKSFCLFIEWKVNSYMVNLLKGVWMVAVTPLPSTWSRTARNIGHLQVGSLINYQKKRKKQNESNYFFAPLFKATPRVLWKEPVWMASSLNPMLFLQSARHLVDSLKMMKRVQVWK